MQGGARLLTHKDLMLVRVIWRMCQLYPRSFLCLHACTTIASTFGCLPFTICDYLIEISTLHSIDVLFPITQLHSFHLLPFFYTGSHLIAKRPLHYTTSIRTPLSLELLSFFLQVVFLVFSSLRLKPLFVHCASFLNLCPFH